jgi:hypothetical protein
MSSVTPNLHLALGSDADENRNWEKIDSLIGLLSGPGVILPGDTEVQGNLTVDGTTDLTGILKAHGDLEAFGNSSLLGFLTVNGALTAQGGLTVSGASPVVFPPGAIAGSALGPNAAILFAASGASNLTPIGLATTPAQLTLLNVPLEVTGHWSLILAQATVRITFGASAPPLNPQIQLSIRRGPTTDVQLRQLAYTALAANAPVIDIPITLVRLDQITDVLQQWQLWASMLTTPAGVSAQVVFSQLHAIQFR